MNVPEDAAHKHVARNGAYCPFCESESIAPWQTEMDGGVIIVAMRCHNCNATWDTLYRLIGVVNR